MTGQYDTPMAIAWGSGCALGIRASLFHSLGGFDPSFFAHYEEIDLCWRIRRAGYQVMCIPDATVYHLGGGTMKYASTQKLFYNFRNSLFMLYKNLSGWSRIKVIFSRLILDGVAGIVFFTEGKFNYIGAIFHAHFSFYKHIFLLNKTRTTDEKNIEAIRIAPPRFDGHFSSSLIWRFFIRKQKTFKKLKP